MKVIIKDGLFHIKQIIKETVELTCKFGLVIVTTDCKEILKPIIYTEIRESLLWSDNLLIKNMDANHIKNALAMVCRCKGEYRGTSNAVWIVLLKYELDFRLYTRAIKLLKKVYQKGTKITIQL